MKTNLALIGACLLVSSIAVAACEDPDAKAIGALRLNTAITVTVKDIKTGRYSYSVIQPTRNEQVELCLSHGITSAFWKKEITYSDLSFDLYFSIQQSSSERPSLVMWMETSLDPSMATAGFTVYSDSIPNFTKFGSVRFRGGFVENYEHTLKIEPYVDLWDMKVEKLKK